MNEDDIRDIMTTLAHKYLHICKHQTAYELKVLENGMMEYGITLDDVSVFAETNILPVKLTV